MPNKPRGRIPHATYIKIIANMLVRDWDILDHCDLLTQLSAIEQLVKHYPERFFCPGVAVRYLLDQSIAYVQRTCSQQSPASDRIIAEYLTLRVAGRTVSAIAIQWGKSRECVSRTTGRKAARMVAERFLGICTKLNTTAHNTE